jgi:negative regulator of flagellin synthesis FlgM
MKIGSPDNQTAVNSLVTDRAASGATRKTSGDTSTSGTSSVNSSDDSTSVQLSDTAAQLLATPSDGTFDADKVARMSQAIKDGTFQANPEKIADKLISNAQELLDRTRNSAGDDSTASSY